MSQSGRGLHIMNGLPTRGGAVMKVTVDHRNVEKLSDLVNVVTDEVAAFCLKWKQGLDQLLCSDVMLIINRKRYGYEVKYHYSSGRWNWLFQLELYYPITADDERQITYMKINKFMTLPMGCGFGKKVFEHLLDCCKLLSELDVIRLRSVRRAIGFWERMKFVNTKEVDGIVNEDCMKIPSALTGYEYVYTIRPCDCDSCKQDNKQS